MEGACARVKGVYIGELRIRIHRYNEINTPIRIPHKSNPRLQYPFFLMHGRPHLATKRNSIPAIKKSAMYPNKQEDGAEPYNHKAIQAPDSSHHQPTLYTRKSKIEGSIRSLSSSFEGSQLARNEDV
ncbi:hypothetical protein OCU04_005980 [Sclerotinia nivalis]|uniref:Uncharacterized protein n=1 Tax=Sclerotinia nivalis TaxID=352851 RepID=A0A9X0DKT1_9HELO|nr:hypothetical protein OCU04_005980 [Sclerotinia nivalis]